MKQVYPPKLRAEYDGKGNTFRVSEYKEGDELYVGVDLVHPSYEPRNWRWVATVRDGVLTEEYLCD